MTRNMKRLGWAGASAAVALTASGLLAPAVAFAGDDQSTAPTSGPEFDATAQNLLQSSEQVQGVAKDGAGNVVVFTSEDESQLDGAAKAFVDTKSNVVVKNVGVITAKAANDLVGGSGYLSPSGANTVSLCSVGFTGWTPSGAPAVITAGHCNADGTLTQSFLTNPQDDPAGGGDANNGDISIKAPLGTLAFSQYGGPNNTEGAQGDTSSVDIATIDVTNNDLNLLPEITDWKTAASGDLSASATDVRAIGKAQINQPASKSGRTTGLTTGTVTEVEGWVRVGDENDARYVYGFGITGGVDTVQGGDSGGAVFQGTTAVGVVSGGNPDGTFLWAADLQAGLARTGGYTVAVKVDAPALTSPANGGTVGVGEAISGTAPAGTKVTVKPSTGAAFDINVDGSGNWSFPAPDKLGTYAFSLSAFSGYNVSPVVPASVEVKAAAPAIVSPANGSTVETALTAVSGTGLPGAVVTLDGAVDGTATVDAEGNWSVPVDLGIGNYTVTAIQARDGETSATATSAFTVAPAAPTITGIEDGATYSGAAIPTSISGTGIDGATITVTINDATVGEAVVKDGTWSIVLQNALGEGAYAVVATQTVSGVSSAASVSFSVAAAASPAPSPSGIPAPGGKPGLPVTGMGDVAPLAWGAAALLLAGFGAFGFRRLRGVTR